MIHDSPRPLGTGELRSRRPAAALALARLLEVIRLSDPDRLSAERGDRSADEPKLGARRGEPGGIEESGKPPP